MDLLLFDKHIVAMYNDSSNPLAGKEKALYGASDDLEFHYYEGLDHDYLPEEFDLMLDYFDKHL